MSLQKEQLMRGSSGWLATSCFVVLSALAAYEMHVVPSSHGHQAKFAEVTESLRFPEQPNITLRTRFTGITGLDPALQFFVAAFLPGAAGFDKNFQVLQAYFLVSLLPVIAIFSIEAGRGWNRGRWTSYTTTWALLYQTLGGAVIVPMYCLVFLYDSSRSDCYSASSRRLRTPYAKALVPALLLGYLLPTILLYVPFSDSSLFTRQGFIALWQPSPIFVNLILFILPVIAHTIYSPSPLRRNFDDKEKDVSYVKSLYRVCFVVSVISHSIMLYTCLTDPQISLSRVFVPHAQMIQSTVGEGLHYIFQVDYLIIFVTILIWTMFAIKDLALTGKTTVGMLQSGSAMAIASVFLGPAATLTAAWWWRENKLRSEVKGRIS